MIQDLKEINAVVESINKSVQLYSYDDISVEDLSNIIFNKLVAGGISTRIIQYTYNGKDLQSVQYYKQKAWVNFDYSGLDMLFQPIYNRTLDPQNIVKEELVDVQYATPEYPDESEEEGDVTQEQVNNGVTNWISNHVSNFASMVTTAVNNYLAAHTNDFKGDTGPAGPGFPSGTYRIPELIESKNVTNQNSVTFSNLNLNSDNEYLVIYELISTSDDSIKICFNGDLNSSAYSTYIHLNEDDTYNLGLHNWDSNFTIGRFYPNSPYATQGESTIKSVPNKGSTVRSEYNFFPSGGMRSLMSYNPASFSNITNLTIFNKQVGNTFSGTIKLYKMVDMVIS